MSMSTPLPEVLDARFDHDDVEAWQAHLNQEGYAVVAGVLDSHQVSETTDHIWSSIEAATDGVKQNDRDSWEAWRLDKRGFITSAIAQGPGAWSVRSNTAVKQVFAAIWGTNQLLVSMDAMIMWKPWWARVDGEEGNPDWFPKTEGIHLDQNPFTKPDLCCIQGMLVLKDISPQVGGLQVIPRSHLPEAKELLKKERPVLKDCGDWCVLGAPKPGQPQPLLLAARAGDLILWDSRTAHGGVVGPGMASGEQTEQLARLAVPVCMTPRAWASDEALAERLEAFEQGAVLSHWPHEQVGSGGHHTDNSSEFRPIELTLEQRELL